MAKNTSLITAQKAANDEFYTQLSDIENELRHYTQHFKDKTVYCNCDDPRVSNFFHYFSHKFQELGLKKLITTCYKNQNPDLFSRHDVESAIMLEYDGFHENENVPNPEDIGIKNLDGDGDFRSDECISILQQADIVVTNPPFSLFRKYVAQLIEHNKQFLIVGNMNAIAYKDIFPLIKENKLWLGVGLSGRDMLFDVSSEYAKYLCDHKKEGSAYRIVNGVVKGRLGNAAWYTNLNHKKRNEHLDLFNRYWVKVKGKTGFHPDTEKYPVYDNYDAIEVGKTAEIPGDYAGVMGVPISFVDKYNPNQFEILGHMSSTTVTEFNFGYPYINGIKKYARVLIRNKQPETPEQVVK